CTIRNCLIADNTTIGSAGGIDCEAEISYPIENFAVIANCTIVNNHSEGRTGGVDLDLGLASATVTNCIVWNNTGRWYDQIHTAELGEKAEVTFCDVQGSWEGLGNIDADPLFADREAGDYHMTRKSPCINAGDPNYMAGPNETDLDGKFRVIGGRIDIGAYEAPIFVEAKIVPQTINLESKGKSITCYIWLPDEYDVTDIEPNSIFLEDEIQPRQFLVDEQTQVATAKFSRSEVQNILDIGTVELTISIWLKDGNRFKGTDVIKVTHEGDGKFAKPEQASNPDPPNGATTVGIDADLSWTAGSYATSHDVYFGTANPPPFIGNQTDAIFDPGTMDYETTYYWRIDEINKWGTTTGDIWHFTTVPFSPSPPPLPPPPPP
ncbi:MAG: choice-of-anchor Q domain-containing protein, partial [Planctomycetota bacterium]